MPASAGSLSPGSVKDLFEYMLTISYHALSEADDIEFWQIALLSLDELSNYMQSKPQLRKKPSARNTLAAYL